MSVPPVSLCLKSTEREGGGGKNISCGQFNRVAVKTLRESDDQFENGMLKLENKRWLGGYIRKKNTRTTMHKNCRTIIPKHGPLSFIYKASIPFMEIRYE